MLHQMATFLRIKMVTYTITLMLEPREFYISMKSVIYTTENSMYLKLTLLILKLLVGIRAS